VRLALGLALADRDAERVLLGEPQLVRTRGSRLARQHPASYPQLAGAPPLTVGAADGEREALLSDESAEPVNAGLSIEPSLFLDGERISATLRLPEPEDGDLPIPPSRGALHARVCAHSRPTQRRVRSLLVENPRAAPARTVSARAAADGAPTRQFLTRAGFAPIREIAERARWATDARTGGADPA
jgi:hypothetical protein